MGMYFFCSLLILQTLNSRGRGESSSDGSSNGPDLSGSSRVDASASSDDKEYYKYECYDPITYTNLLLNISCAGTPKDPCPTDISYKFLLDDADAALQKTMSLGSEMNQTSTNPIRPSMYDDNIKKVDYQMEIYDAYYNGTFSMTLEPDQSNRSSSHCSTFTSQVLDDAYLRIGPPSRGEVSKYGVNRKEYDSNVFFMALGRTFTEEACPYTPNKVFFSMKSSDSKTTSGTAWQLNATKTGGQFDIMGSLTSRLATFGNYYYYIVNQSDTGVVSPGSLSSGNFSCPMRFDVKTLTSVNAASISGSVDANQANFKWKFVDPVTGYRITGTFFGKAWKDGAKIDFTNSDTITTSGVSKGSKAGTGNKFIDGDGKWIILAAVLGVLLVVGYYAFKCLRRRRQRQRQKMLDEVRKGLGGNYSSSMLHF